MYLNSSVVAKMTQEHCSQSCDALHWTTVEKKIILGHNIVFKTGYKNLNEGQNAQ